MKRTLQFALAAGALVLGLGGVASAAMIDRGMPMMHGARGMHGMSGGGMMSMMMGDDSVAGCSSMMKKVAANPKIHREMNAMMKSQMKSGDVTTSKPLATPKS